MNTKTIKSKLDKISWIDEDSAEIETSLEDDWEEEITKVLYSIIPQLKMVIKKHNNKYSRKFIQEYKIVIEDLISGAYEYM